MEQTQSHLQRFGLHTPPGTFVQALEALRTYLGLDEDLVRAAVRAWDKTAAARERARSVAFVNQAKVTSAFIEERVADFHLAETTGYGYDDAGRETLDKVYARVFGTEAALVRPQMVSGTHSIAAALFGALRPGGALISACGRPYDTLCAVIGIGDEPFPGSLAEWAVRYLEVPLGPDGYPDESGVVEAARDEAISAAAAGRPGPVVFIQRSRGYSSRPSLAVERIGRLIRNLKQEVPEAVVVVDNCYGEFVETAEPSEVGADLVAGSLIKNPGGGLAPTGGYVLGKAALVERAAAHLTAPGIGGEAGPSLGVARLLFQGLFLAPHVVGQAVEGSIFASALLGDLGFRVSPRYDEPRTDLILAVELGSPDRVVAFCQGIQAASPVGSMHLPVPAPMPGYADQVIMAAGTFVQGASIELSADAAVREPYTVYVQGGLTVSHVIMGILSAVQRMRA